MGGSDYMKVKACCDMMRRLMNNPNVMVSEECIPPVFGFGVGMNMDYCPWCGAKLEKEETTTLTVKVKPVEIKVEIDGEYDPDDEDQRADILDQITDELGGIEIEYTVVGLE